VVGAVTREYMASSCRRERPVGGIAIGVTPAEQSCDDETTKLPIGRKTKGALS